MGKHRVILPTPLGIKLYILWTLGVSLEDTNKMLNGEVVNPLLTGLNATPYNSPAGRIMDVVDLEINDRLG